MPSLIIAQGSANVPGDIASVTLDTRGASIIYMFGYSVFGVAEPLPLHFDSEGNTWFELANTFSTCNGGLNGYRVFNPNVSTTHTFRVGGNSINGTQLVVLALAPTFTGPSYILRRADSNVNPAKPGLLNPLINNFAMVTAVMAGCGLAAPTVDSGFAIAATLPQMSVAIQVLATPSPIDVTWTGIVPGTNPNTRTAGTIIEGFGVYTGQPPLSKSNTRIYEA